MICNLCPRGCSIDRSVTVGYCGVKEKMKLARAALHHWEEPCISGTNGSGAVFFSGCSLKCCFCQNYQISANGFGKECSAERLAEIFLELQEQGAHNINLVTPTHYIPQIISALEKAKQSLHIPVVYNSSAYESTESLKKLDGLIDIYLPDLKFYDSALSKRYANAPNYFEYASAAVLEMFRQTGAYQIRDGLLRRGMIIRHMILPGAYRDSIKIVEWIAAHFSAGEILVSLMSQYIPCHNSKRFPEINRRLTSFEYQKVLDAVLQHGLQGYMQERSSANEAFTPPFDLTGV